MISRRSFLGGAVGGAIWSVAAGSHARAAQSPTATVLYNGIRLGRPWPPDRRSPNEHPVTPPYLADRPAVVPIDVGRQLFVDDFLIEHTSMARTFHRATYHPANPILTPDTEWERRDDMAERTRQPSNPSAMVFSDGVFYDWRDRLFKMWYMGGYGMFTCLATSADGITWQRPTFDVVPGTNIVNTAVRDSSTVWFDPDDADPRRRFKKSIWYDHSLVLYASPDGVHWTALGTTGVAGDRSTFFYNPFRRVWVFSVRDNQFKAAISGRYRSYWESAEFSDALRWSDRAPVAWVKADSADFARPGYAERAELYNLDCVAYESLMLGLFSVWRGESSVREKINEIALGFSRDGFHWDRPDRASFLPVSEEVGSWNWGNVQSAGGGCLVVGDLLYFYVSGRQGRPGTEAPGVCSTGLATLRRDGFASMDWRTDERPRARRADATASAEGTLTTRPVRFSGSHLFVNADLRGGELRVEVLDRQGQVLAPLSRDHCVPVAGDSTRAPVRWTSGALAAVAGQEVRFRFTVSRGKLFAFWVSAWPSGESRGYPAAGGPEFEGPVDRK